MGLLKLKEWVSLPEAAQYLTAALNTSVCESDLLQVALEENLQLSLEIDGSWAFRGTAEWEHSWDSTTPREHLIDYGREEHSGTQLVFRSTAMTRLGPGVYDLAPSLCTRQELLLRYRELVRRPYPDVGAYSVFLKDERELYQLITTTTSDRKPLTSFPVDSLLVVRTSAVTALESKLAGVSSPIAEACNVDPASAPLTAFDRQGQSELASSPPAASSVPDAFQLSEHDLSSAIGRRNAIEHFLRYSSELADCRLMKKHIWQTLRHRTARDFQYWQADDPKTTKACDQAIRTLLADPQKFVERLHRQLSLASGSNSSHGTRSIIV